MKKNLFYNGKIYSESFSKIFYAVYVNEKGIVEELFSSKEQIPYDFFEHSTDLKGNTVYPGFHDCHVHLEFLTNSFSEVLFDENCDKYNFLEVLKQKIRLSGPGEWIRGGGFGRTFLEDMPKLSEIDKISNDNPIFFYSKDIHSFLINSKTMEFIPQNKRHIFDEYCQKDKNNNFTGLIFEKGEDIFEEYLKTDKNLFEQNFIKTQQYFHKHGITTVHNMDDDVIADYIVKEKENIKLNILNYYRNPQNRDNKIFYGRKLFVDGSLGSLTCWMKQNFTNYDFAGIPVLDENDIEEILKQCSSENIKVAVHAIGDKAVSVLFDKFEKYKMRNSRIEHAQTISDEDIRRVRDKWLSMQPLHIKDDISISIKYLSDRIENLYRFRSILKNSGNLIFGSDVPVVEADVIKGIFWATSREDRNREWNSQETISVRQALMAYTKTPSLFERQFPGDITEGSQADMVVLSQDIMGSDNILNTNVLMTVYNGEIVFNDF